MASSEILHPQTLASGSLEACQHKTPEISTGKPTPLLLPPPPCLHFSLTHVLIQHIVEVLKDYGKAIEFPSL